MVSSFSSAAFLESCAICFKVTLSLATLIRSLTKSWTSSNSSRCWSEWSYISLLCQLGVPPMSNWSCREPLIYAPPRRREIFVPLPLMWAHDSREVFFHSSVEPFYHTVWLWMLLILIIYTPSEISWICDLGQNVSPGEHQTWWTNCLIVSFPRLLPSGWGWRKLLAIY